MKKKNVQWLGYLLIVGYILLFIFLIYTKLFEVAVVWTMFAIPLIPATYKMALFYSLPDKTEAVKVVDKQQFQRGNIVTRWFMYYLSLEFPGGIVKRFNVTKKVFDIVYMNASGLLTYRERGKIRFFRSLIIK